MLYTRIMRKPMPMGHRSVENRPHGTRLAGGPREPPSRNSKQHAENKHADLPPPFFRWPQSLISVILRVLTSPSLESVKRAVPFPSSTLMPKPLDL